VEPMFHKDSYGYISGKSALDAVGTVRKRCWWYDWVIDLDIQGFFDTIDHWFMMHAVKEIDGKEVPFGFYGGEGVSVSLPHLILLCVHHRVTEGTEK